METGPVNTSWRFKLGALLLIGLALYSGWQSVKYYDIGNFIRRYEKFGTVASDGISRFEKQLACLRADLSPGERVGFLSPLEGDDRVEVYLWTQYALAPIVVTDAQSEEKVIAIYPDEQSLQQATADRYQILVDCKNGVGLLSLAGTQ
jgi:hypothetical protein